MDNEIKINEHSCPLMVQNNLGSRFLGSGFFFQHRGVVFGATADHCVEGYEGQFQLISGSGINNVEIAARSQAYDLCLFTSKLSCNSISMVLSSALNKPGNIQLLVFEFSTTEVVNSQFRLNPATRTGNCVRVFSDTRMFGSAGENMLELSFPALKGASGSAVVEILHSQLIVHGVVVANVERHLLPAQIETVLDEKNEILEERKYFLPQAAAVNSVHLMKMADNWIEGNS